MILTFLNYFVAGIAFCVGVTVGAWIVKGLATRQNLEANEKFLSHAKRVEDRLEKYIEHSAVLAMAAKRWIADRDATKKGGVCG